MATVAEALIGRHVTLPREVAGGKPRPAAGPPKQDRDDSPFLHPGVGDALVLAASSLDLDPAAPQVVAVVLEDGSVHAAGQPATANRWGEGWIRGKDWTLWWARRVWTKA